MANTRTVTQPSAGDDGTATWAGQVYTDIGNLFSDKTLYTATDGATVTFNLNNGSIQTVTLGGNRILALSNVTIGRPFMIRLVQDGSGSRTVTWWTTIKWPGGVAPSLSTSPNVIDAFMFIPTSSGIYDAYFVGFGLTS